MTVGDPSKRQDLSLQSKLRRNRRLICCCFGLILALTMLSMVGLTLSLLGVFGDNCQNEDGCDGDAIINLITTPRPSATELYLLKDGHKPKKLSQSKLRQFSALTDIDRFMGPDRLDPFLKERVPGTLGNVQVRQYIVNNLRNLGSWDIEEDRFEDPTPKGTKEFVNIIATLRNPNQEPESDLKLVMACHYDSKLFPTDTFIGATDSAVPCAMLLDLAHNLRGSFAAKTYQPYTLQLIFFDGEEAFEQWSSADSLYGSRHLAQKWAEMPHRSHNAGLLDGIGLFVLLDLLGAPQPKIQNHYPNSLSGRTFSHLQNIEQRLAQANELTSYNRNNPYFVDSTNYAGKIDDDHRPFLRKGVDDILHVIATPFPRVWHTPSDNESNLDRDTISNLSKIFHVFVAEFLHLKPPE